MGNWKERICGIYKITSPVGRVYIGQSVYIQKRKADYACLHNCNEQRKLFNSLVKYGWLQHDFEIIEECHRELLNEREVYHIAFYNSVEDGLNIYPGGNQPIVSDSTRQKIRAANLGKRHSVEARRKMSLSKAGTTPWNKGLVGVQDGFNKGRTFSIEHREKLRIARSGKTRSADARARTSISLKIHYLKKKHNILFNNLNTLPMDEVKIVTPTEGEAVANLIRMEIDLAVQTAKAFPRDLALCKKNVLFLAAADKETAESCFFSLPRKKKNDKGDWEEANIEGESIRLAEVVASSWKNIKFAKRILSIDRVGKKITAQAVVFDMENNVNASVEETRNISSKGGQIYSEDMITMTGKAAQSIALRNAIFQVIPKAFFKQILKEVKAVAIGSKPGTMEDAKDFKPEPLDERIAKAIKFFVNWGIAESRIFHSLNVKSTTEMTEEHLATLTGTRNGITQGEFSLLDAFPLTAEEESKEIGKSIINSVKGKSAEEMQAKADKLTGKKSTIGPDQPAP